jgi:hypothetical protein
MAQGSDRSDESGQNGVGGRLPAGQAEMFGDEPNAAAPFARLAPRGQGRPKGSANKRTLAMRDVYLRMGYAHPMLWMGEVLSRPVAQLAEELACDKVEALDVQRKIAADLAPYLESKMPTTVAASKDDGLPVLIVGEIKAARASLALPEGAMAIDDDLADAIEENQRVSAERGEQSHDDKSHEAAKVEQDQQASAPDPAN